MSNIATTIEQSKRLLVLGLDIKSADMCLCKTAQDTWFLCAGTPGEYDAHTVPAWSLSALLNVMPKNTNETYHLFSSMMANQLGSWVCDRSKYYIDTNGYNKNDYECFKSDNPITAAYEMVCWLLEQGFIKKGGKL